jgi:hypothetical protein
MFKVNQKVRDRDGFVGYIDVIFSAPGVQWYDVKFPSGVAVRLGSELTLVDAKEQCK